jgi:ribosome-associated protein
MNLEELKDLIVFELEEKKAENIKVIDVRGSGIAVYMIFASGRSSKNVSSIADSVSINVKNKTGFKVVLEGFRTGTWVILEVEGIIVHIFHPETREYYNVEEIFESSAGKNNKA